MWNIFKNNSPIAVLEKPNTKIESVNLIDSKHIQKDLKDSLDKLLNESGINYTRQSEIETLRANLNSFKEQNDILYKKINLLKELGFTNTPSTIIQKEKLEQQEREINSKIMTLRHEIRYYENLDTKYKEYSLKYPTFKFIPAKLMNDILKKYNLFLGYTCFYGKEIPMDALEIASGFTSEINESKYDIEIVKSTSGHSRYHRYDVKKKIEKAKSSEEAYYQAMTGSSDYVVKTFSLSKLKIVAPMSHFTIPTIEFREQNIPVVKIDKDNYLKIDIDELNAKAIEEAKKIEALDPILILEVSEGFIVLKAWDEEADIIEIQNELLN